MDRKECKAFFTVEAAMVMPIVFACYLLTAVLMIYIYERCIWEQNGCRLPVWKEYVEGMADMSPAAEEVSERDICRYLLQCLEEEESEKFFLGQDITAQINSRGAFVQVSRGSLYTQFGHRSYDMEVFCVCLKPVEYIRMTILLKEQMKEEEENDSE